MCKNVLNIKNIAMCTSFLLLILFSQMIKSQDEEEFTIPTPKYVSNTMEPEFLTKVDGCNFKTNRNRTIICTGVDCKNFKAPKDIQQPEILKIITSRISVFRKGDFREFWKLKSLEIQFNLELVRFEPGCFENLTLLTNLSISINHNLKSLDENVFDGLVNLQELYLFKNGFTKVIDVTRSLAPKYVPNLLCLYLNENVFRVIENTDFSPMVGTKLNSLQLTLCQIDYIEPQSFNPLKNLTELFIGQNQFNVTTLENLLDEIISKKIPLTSLSLNDSGFRRNPPYTLLKKIAETNITQLNLGRNMFDNINNTSFPLMPNITYLDLSECLLLDVARGTFDNLPNLKTLLLKQNRLPSISPGMTLKQLKKFDISGNSGNQISKSYFRIDDNVFTYMSELIELLLDFNLITQITSYTFTGLKNLRHLGLKNATIFSIDQGAFRHLPHLQFLNLENNKFTITLKAEMFKGMSELKVLLLGNCAIEHLINPSPFQYLTNLTYLGLQGNSLYSLSSIQFSSLSSLRILDLSINKLIEWDQQKFINPTIKQLDLSQNKIKTITPTMLDDFKNLDNLNLESNPFTCDCLMKDASKWLRSKNYSSRYIKNNGLSAKCVNPDEWSQESIINYMVYILLKETECLDSPNNSQVVWISVLSVFGSLVVVSSILGYIYRLHLRHWVLLSRMALRRYMRRRRNNTGMQYKYDAFVSYSNEDQEFVVKMVAELEDNAPNFKLCVYERDFQIGTAISESVLQSVAASRRTLLVVSDSFAKSQWCRWEAKLAEHHQLFFHDGDFQAPHGTLLIILLGKVAENNMTPTLKYLLKTRIYLQWCEKPENQKLFWHKLRKKLMAPNNATYETCLNETT